MDSKISTVCIGRGCQGEAGNDIQGDRLGAGFGVNCVGGYAGPPTHFCVESAEEFSGVVGQLVQGDKCEGLQPSVRAKDSVDSVILCGYGGDSDGRVNKEVHCRADKMQRYECRVGRVEADYTTYWMLSKMAWTATKLYNTAMWDARKAWEGTGKIPNGFALQKVVLASPHHSLLPAHTYQHPAHQVWGAFKGWFQLRKKDPTANPPGTEFISQMRDYVQQTLIH